ncbi:MAG: aminotransferase class III-fold pyridoxal phosphate-dependent enzyme, partial [Verrucomicrobia bacterium]|nr:aminotransferase class III-fold pyridoxal phosphate-dependent enzyme [Verrucomicrobiota bacterium]
GIELAENIPAFASTGKVASLNFVNRLHDAGVLTVPSGTQVVRFLPALNLTRAEAAEGVALIAGIAKAIA